MKIVIAILSILLLASAAIIFFLYKVLKNTCKELVQFIIEDELNIDLESAYDGKYYPCTLFLDVVKGSPHTRIFDFSLYESHQIVGAQIITDDFKDDEEDFYGTKIVPNVVVYQPMEGCWMWKPSQ